MKCISDLCTSTYNFILKFEIIQYIINLIKKHTPQKEEEIHKKDEDYIVVDIQGEESIHLLKNGGKK